MYQGSYELLPEVLVVALAAGHTVKHTVEDSREQWYQADGEVGGLPIACHLQNAEQHRG